MIVYTLLFVIFCSFVEASQMRKASNRIKRAEEDCIGEGMIYNSENGFCECQVPYGMVMYEDGSEHCIDCSLVDAELADGICTCPEGLAIDVMINQWRCVVCSDLDMVQQEDFCYCPSESHDGERCLPLDCGNDAYYDSFSGECVCRIGGITYTDGECICSDANGVVMYEDGSEHCIECELFDAVATDGVCTCPEGLGIYTTIDEWRCIVCSDYDLIQEGDRCVVSQPFDCGEEAYDVDGTCVCYEETRTYNNLTQSCECQAPFGIVTLSDGTEQCIDCSLVDSNSTDGRCKCPPGYGIDTTINEWKCVYCQYLDMIQQEDFCYCPSESHDGERCIPLDCGNDVNYNKLTGECECPISGSTYMDNIKECQCEYPKGIIMYDNGTEHCIDCSLVDAEFADETCKCPEGFGIDTLINEWRCIDCSLFNMTLEEGRCKSNQVIDCGVEAQNINGTCVCYEETRTYNNSTNTCECQAPYGMITLTEETERCVDCSMYNMTLEGDRCVVNQVIDCGTEAQDINGTCVCYEETRTYNNLTQSCECQAPYGMITLTEGTEQCVDCSMYNMTLEEGRCKINQVNECGTEAQNINGTCVCKDQMKTYNNSTKTCECLEPLGIITYSNSTEQCIDCSLVDAEMTEGKCTCPEGFGIDTLINEWRCIDCSLFNMTLEKGRCKSNEPLDCGEEAQDINGTCVCKDQMKTYNESTKTCECQAPNGIIVDRNNTEQCIDCSIIGANSTDGICKCHPGYGIDTFIFELQCVKCSEYNMTQEGDRCVCSTNKIDNITGNCVPPVISENCGENIDFTITGTTLTISGFGKMNDFNDEILPPWEKQKSIITTIIIENKLPENTEEIETSSNNESDNENENENEIPLKRNVQSQGIESIGENAFKGMTKVENITIPSTVTSIGEGAFEGCSSLKSVTYNGNTDPCQNGVSAFGNETTIYVTEEFKGQSFCGSQSIKQQSETNKKPDVTPEKKPEDDGKSDTSKTTIIILSVIIGILVVIIIISFIILIIVVVMRKNRKSNLKNMKVFDEENSIRSVSIELIVTSSVSTQSEDSKKNTTTSSSSSSVSDEPKQKSRSSSITLSSSTTSEQQSNPVRIEDSGIARVEPPKKFSSSSSSTSDLITSSSSSDTSSSYYSD